MDAEKDCVAAGGQRGLGGGHESLPRESTMASFGGFAPRASPLDIAAMKKPRLAGRGLDYSPLLRSGSVSTWLAAAGTPVHFMYFPGDVARPLLPLEIS